MRIGEYPNGCVETGKRLNLGEFNPTSIYLRFVVCHPELACRVRGGGCVEQLKDLILATSKGGLERHGLRVPALESGRPGFKSGFFHLLVV